jgi:hypothetical protein
MERYIGMDVHAASCTIAVISEKGRKLKDFPVETNGQGGCGEGREHQGDGRLPRLRGPPSPLCSSPGQPGDCET